MRVFACALLFSSLLAGAANAQSANPKCKLDIWTHIQMERSSSGLRNLVPIKLNGVTKKFILDTGGFVTQVSRPVAEELKLPIRQGKYTMLDLTGNVSRDQALVKELMIGNLLGKDVPIQVMTLDGPDGLLAVDQMIAMDTDMDFGKDTLRFFSPDHCPGEVVYWTNPASVAIVPFTMDGFHIRLPVKLDGNSMYAILDTGAPSTVLNLDEGRRVFGLEPGSADTPEDGVLNGDATLKKYTHKFKSLSLGDIAINDPQIGLIPDATLSKLGVLERSPSGSHAVVRKQQGSPDVIIGMNVLRKLHIYFAFKERKMYISPAAAATTP